jgi:hypothetical protein
MQGYLAVVSLKVLSEYNAQEQKRHKTALESKLNIIFVVLVPEKPKKCDEPTPV